MNIVVYSYLVYLAVSILLTIWVARTLFKRGGIFLVDAFHGNQALAESINHLLVVGFYLINIGYVALALRYGDRPVAIEDAIEILSTKIGLVLVILGIMHFLNLAIFTSMRRGALASRVVTPLLPHPAAAILETGGGFRPEAQ